MLEVVQQLLYAKVLIKYHIPSNLEIKGGKRRERGTEREGTDKEMEKRNLFITTSISSLIALERMVSSRAAMAPMLHTQLIIVTCLM